MGKKQRSAKASLLGSMQARTRLNYPLGHAWAPMGSGDGSFKSEQFTSEQQAAAYCAPCFKAGPRPLNRAP